MSFPNVAFKSLQWINLLRQFVSSRDSKLFCLFQERKHIYRFIFWQNYQSSVWRILQNSFNSAFQGISCFFGYIVQLPQGNINILNNYGKKRKLKWIMQNTDHLNLVLPHTLHSGITIKWGFNGNEICS